MRGRERGNQQALNLNWDKCQEMRQKGPEMVQVLLSHHIPQEMSEGEDSIRTHSYAEADGYEQAPGPYAQGQALGQKGQMLSKGH